MNYNVKHMTQISNIFNTPLEISGNDNKDLQLTNIPSILFIEIISHFEISGKCINDMHPENISDIDMIFLFPI